MSKKFQEEGSVVADVSLTIKSTVRALELLSTKDGPFLQKLGEFEKCEYPTAGSNTRRTYKLMGSDGQQWWIQDFHGGHQPHGGCQLPRQLCFEKFVCQNERIWTLGGACTGDTPLDLPMVRYHQVGKSSSNYFMKN